MLRDQVLYFEDPPHERALVIGANKETQLPQGNNRIPPNTQ